MDLATFLAFAVFIIVMTGTPGPGNLTFLAIGASAGYRTAFPVIVASQIGSIPLKLSVAYGLGHVMAGGGPIVTLFKVLSMAYMTYLAWRIISLSVKPKGEVALPSFWEGLLIHPLSPKTWAMNLVAFFNLSCRKRARHSRKRTDSRGRIYSGWHGFPFTLGAARRFDPCADRRRAGDARHHRGDGSIHACGNRLGARNLRNTKGTGRRMCRPVTIVSVVHVVVVLRAQVPSRIGAFLSLQIQFSLISAIGKPLAALAFCIRHLALMHDRQAIASPARSNDW